MAIHDSVPTRLQGPSAQQGIEGNVGAIGSTQASAQLLGAVKLIQNALVAQPTAGSRQTAEGDAAMAPKFFDDVAEASDEGQTEEEGNHASDVDSEGNIAGLIDDEDRVDEERWALRIYKQCGVVVQCFS